MRPSSLRASSTQVAAPSCSKPSSAAWIASRAPSFFRSRLRRCRARAMHEPCQRVSDLLVLRGPPGRGANRRDRPPPGRRRQDHGIGSPGRTPTQGRRERRPPPRRRGVESHLDPAELEQKLDLVAAPPPNAGLAPVERGCLPLGLTEPIDRPGRISTPACDEPGDRHVAGGRRPNCACESSSASSNARAPARAGLDGRR